MFGNTLLFVEEIGLFPLGIVLLPSEQVPLHIFEPRYRELIGECIDEDTEFGLVFAHENGIAPVGTRASVSSVLQRFPDGRLNVVVQGGSRFRVVELTEGRSFQTALVDELDDDVAAAAAESTEIDRALGAFAALLELAGAEPELQDPGDPMLSFTLAGRFELSVEIKLELLSATSERDRLVRVAEILESAAEAIERQRAIAGLAQRNGKAN